MRNAWQDFRYALRLLLRSPGFSIIAVLCLALGVGANTAVFSVVNAVILRPLPYPDPSRLTAVYETNEKRGVRVSSVCPADFQNWRDQIRSFDSIAAYQPWNPNLTGTDEPERLEAVQVSGDFFRVLGVPPAAGRTIERDDEARRSLVAVLSHALWERRFGRDPKLIGQNVRLDGESYLVAGIMPPGFQFPDTNVDLWTPLALDPSLSDRGEHSLYVIARVKQAASLASARREIGDLMKRIDMEFRNAGCGADLALLHDWFAGDTKHMFWTLAGAVGLVLLIACANLSNLLLARGSRRAQELSIRSHLGASRGRLISQLLIESVCLGLMGGFAGLLLSVWGSDLLASLLPVSMTAVFGPANIDARVLAYTLALSLASGLAFGVAPAFRATRPDSGGDQSGLRVIKSRLGSTMLVSQTALALILLAGAGLLIRSFLSVYRIDPGFTIDNVLTGRIDLATRRSESGGAAFYQEVLDRLAAMPGVVFAGLVTDVPLSGRGSGGYISFEGRPASALERHPGASRLIVSPDYFRTLRIALRAGRVFNSADHAGAPPVVIINETLAKTYWPGESPIGRRMKRGTLPAPFPWLTVVGVTADVKQNSLTGAVSPTIYLPFLQNLAPGMTILARANSAPEKLAVAMRTAVRSIDKDHPVASIRTLEDVHWSALASRRTVAIWMIVFAALALVLATLGVYGVTAYAVARRTREFGIRIAMGASRAEVLRVAVHQGLICVVTGIGLGLAGAAALTRLVSGWLYQVGPMDGWSFGGAAALFTVTAVAASYLPARRAATLDPVYALRHE